MESKDVKKIVREGYSQLAKGGCCGCSCNSKVVLDSSVTKSLGYSDEEIANVPEANLGLGCGNPTALANIKPGDTVLDLGCGAGFDVFLASKKVGETGKVIGVDMTPEMIEKANANVEKYGYKNTEFVLGDIENLPIESESVDVVISNCVINLAPDKDKVFSEAFRVLKKGGKMYLSDIVLLGSLTQEQLNDSELLTGCVAGAIMKEDYIEKVENAGFRVRVLGEDKGISKRQYSGIDLESLKIEATKLEDEDE